MINSSSNSIANATCGCGKVAQFVACGWPGPCCRRVASASTVDQHTLNAVDLQVWLAATAKLGVAPAS